MRTFGFGLLFILAPAFSHAHDSGVCLTLLQPNQRNMAMARELAKLRPTGEQPELVNVDSNADLAQLSRENQARLLKQIEQIVPQTQLGPNIQSRIDALLAQADFVSLRPLRGEDPELGIVPEDDFYSALTGGSSSAGFIWVATKKRAPLLNLAGHVGSDAARLDLAFEQGHGLILPHFAQARSLIIFFETWDPEPLEKLVRANRYNLPASAWTIDGFMAQIDTRLNTREIFPWPSLYQRMAPLRQRLSRFAMTREDAAVFHVELMRRYLYRAVGEGTQSIDDLESEWNREGGAGRVFNRVLNAFGWEGVATRVPRNVPAHSIYIVRAAETATHAILDHSRGLPGQKRIDYRKMPDGTPLNLR